MKTQYHYVPGTVRYRQHDGNGDVRVYRAPKGWKVMAMILEYNPVTHAPSEPRWWFRETYVGVGNT